MGRSITPQIMTAPPVGWDGQPWAVASSAADPLLKISWSRAVAALRRSRWLMALVLVLGLAIGIAAARFSAPVYEAQARLWIADDATARNRTGAAPIRTAGLMRPTAWPELLTSFSVLDTVVRKTTLNVMPATAADAALFADFRTDSQFTAGAYQLVADKSGWQYQLLDGRGKVLQSGLLGDSIGQALGFHWRPVAANLRAGSVVKFTVVSVRNAAEQVRRNLRLTFDPQSNVLGVALTGENPERTATVLKAVIDEFRALVGQLKSHNASEVTRVLQQQVAYEEGQLRDAEAQLEQFRVQHATMSGPQTRRSDSTDEVSSLFASYLSRKLELDSLRGERETLEQTLSAVKSGTLDPTAVWMLPTVRVVAPPELRTALVKLDSSEAELQSAVLHYTDDNGVVQGLRTQIENLKATTIPSAVSGVLVEVGRRERELDVLVSDLAKQLRVLPAENTEENRLRRNVETHSVLYATLRRRSEEASLAERGATTDVTVLDPVVVPSQSDSARTPFVILLALMVSGGVALAVAMVRDRLDSRFRYPEQASDDLGLEVLGMVPTIKRRAFEGGEHARRVTEGFRSIRMTVANALGAGEGFSLTVSSPAPGDGKSFVSANLALAFAAAGTPTLLVDGDLRRGELHKRFDVDAVPGLVDWLNGEASLEKTLRGTTDGNLSVMPRGTFDPNAPELLKGERLNALLGQLRERFRAIIIDSPPLGAGFDPLAFGAASGNLVVVLRSGKTDRRLAAAQLRVVNRLPIHVVGTVLNDTSDVGAFQYYGYMDLDLRSKESQSIDATRHAEFAQRLGLTR